LWGRDWVGSGKPLLVSCVDGVSIAKAVASHRTPKMILPGFWREKSDASWPVKAAESKWQWTNKTRLAWAGRAQKERSVLRTAVLTDCVEKSS
jgi:hypothetical protein